MNLKMFSKKIWKYFKALKTYLVRILNLVLGLNLSEV